MVVIVKKDMDSKKLQAAIRKVKSNAVKGGFPADTFFGKIKLKGSPLSIQKKLRNEWGK